MKLVHVELLICRGALSESDLWKDMYGEIADAISRVVWPPGNDRFAIYPEPKANGVVPIKQACMATLRDLYGWQLEARYKIGYGKGTGPIDALRPITVDGIGSTYFALEWETGNVSSTHRSLNKISLGMKEGRLAGGAVILPTRALYRYLTDRVGNFEEITPFLPFWRGAVDAEGVLGLFVVEHDDTSMDVPRIKKGTDGRALR